MPIVNEGIISELGYVEKPFELNHIKGLFENTDPAEAGDGVRADHRRPARGGPADQAGPGTTDSRRTQSSTPGLIAGMAIVGVKFRDNIIFVPEVLVAARAMKAGMAHLEPILSASGIEPVGTVIMGTVRGDLHDIGKNLCIMMLRGSGFVVHDLGVDTKPDEFIDAVVEHDAKVLGMSALLTTTMPNMGKTIDAFEEAGLREMVKIMVGGAPVTQEFADDMGADGYGKDAIACVEKAKELVGLTSEPEPVAVG